MYNQQSNTRDAPVMCFCTRTTMTGRPDTSLWVCRYALPVAASLATSVTVNASALRPNKARTGMS